LFDISYIQLLLSSEKMARQAKKKIYLDGPQSESFQILLKNSGCMAVPAIRKLLRIGEEERKSDE
jgi:hypothetical protein